MDASAQAKPKVFRTLARYVGAAVVALVGRVSLGILLADPLLVGDSSGYDLIALNLLDGNGISLDGSPSARRAPLRRP